MENMRWGVKIQAKKEELNKQRKVEQTKKKHESEDW